MSRLENLLAVVCALLRLAFCAWRAAHQSIVIDEAITYNRFVSGPWLKLFGRYDANNHILSSVLIKGSVTLFGVSEFTLRLPSLLAGFFLTLGFFWLLKPVKSTAVRWAVFLALCLHPALIDFSIAARGYSLSLALFVWALYFCMERRYLLAGTLLGLSIGANLSMLFPVLAILAVASLLERRLLVSLILPALLVGAVINGPPLRHASRGDFYLGYPELRPAVTSWVFTSLHASRDGILGGKTAAEFIALLGLPLVCLLVAWRARSRTQLLPFLTMALTMAGLILARWLFGVAYPADRTCLYFAILAAVSWALAADSFDSPRMRALWLIPTALLAIQFATQLQTRYFQFWQAYARENEIASVIRERSAGKPPGSMSVSATWPHQPAIEFYRHAWNLAALQPIERNEPTPLSGFDFYILSDADVDRPRPANLHPVWSNADVGVLVLVNDN